MTAVKLQVVSGFLRPVGIDYISDGDEGHIAALSEANAVLEGWKELHEIPAFRGIHSHFSDYFPDYSPWRALGVRVGDKLNETDLLPWRGFPLDNEEAR